MRVARFLIAVAVAAIVCVASGSLFAQAPDPTQIPMPPKPDQQVVKKIFSMIDKDNDRKLSLDEVQAWVVEAVPPGGVPGQPAIMVLVEGGKVPMGPPGMPPGVPPGPPGMPPGVPPGPPGMPPGVPPGMPPGKVPPPVPPGPPGMPPGVPPGNVPPGSPDKVPPGPPGMPPGTVPPPIPPGLPGMPPGVPPVPAPGSTVTPGQPSGKVVPPGAPGAETVPPPVPTPGAPGTPPGKVPPGPPGMPPGAPPVPAPGSTVAHGQSSGKIVPPGAPGAETVPPPVPTPGAPGMPPGKVPPGPPGMPPGAPPGNVPPGPPDKVPPGPPGPPGTPPEGHMHPGAGTPPPAGMERPDAPVCTEELRNSEQLPQAVDVPCKEKAGNLLFRTVCNQPGYDQVAITLPAGREAGCFGIEAITKNKVVWGIRVEGGADVFKTGMGPAVLHGLIIGDTAPSSTGKYTIYLDTAASDPDARITVRFVDYPR